MGERRPDRKYRCSMCHEPTPYGWTRCLDCNRDYVKSRNPREREAALKAEVMGHYGGKCECCDVSDLVFLTIDHIGGGGAAHRRESNLRGGKLYRWLQVQGYPDGFRVLCFNCNFATYANGVCPHREIGPGPHPPLDQMAVPLFLQVRGTA